jgi:hypothetical protein
MLRCVALVRTYVSDELSACVIRVTRIGDLGTELAVTCSPRTLRSNTMLADSCHSDDGSYTFLRTVSYYKSHTAKHPKGRLLHQ